MISFFRNLFVEFFNLGRQFLAVNIWQSAPILGLRVHFEVLPIVFIVLFPSRVVRIGHLIEIEWFRCDIEFFVVSPDRALFLLETLLFGVGLLEITIF